MSKVNKVQRFVNIINILNHSNGLSAKDIASRLDICERTAYRHLRELRALGYPVHPSRDPETNKRKHLLTPVSFTGAEALALASASQSLLNQSGLSLCQELKSALRKVESVILSGEDTQTYRRLKPHFTYLSERLRDYSPWQEMIATVNESMRRHRCLSAVYDSFSGGKVSERLLDPYELFWGDGNLYLAAFCHSRLHVCTFRIDRFKSVKALAKTFTRDPAFDLAGYLSSSFSVWSGTDEITIRFHVYPPSSRFFRESCYHHSQHIEELPEGNIICTLTVNDSPEIKSWLLSWGKQIEVLEPQKLREEIKQELQAGLERYYS